MKTNQTLLLFFIFIFFSLNSETSAQRIMAAGTEQDSTSKDSDLDVSLGPIDIGVTFGRKSLGCKKFGVCSGDVDIFAKSVKTSMGYSSKSSSIILMVDESELLSKQPDILQYLKGQNSVQIEESFEFSDQIKSKLGTSKALKINPGKYSVTKKEGKYILKFKS
ncbi:MAG: hypothetical protein IPM42_07980 [Saprospiraceae bacterium]|nr:hypothetical protein [Saprospiraceae bacterium]